MKELRVSLAKIIRGHQGLMWLMILLFGSGLVLFVVSILTLNPNAAVVNLGYSDVGGYRSGNWTGMISFAILAVVLGVLNNLLVLRVFQKKGEGMARVLAMVSVGMVVGAFIVLLRILGEN